MSACLCGRFIVSGRAKYPAAAVLKVGTRKDHRGRACGLEVSQRIERLEWARLAQGAYLLRTNHPASDPVAFWRWYTQLSQAEAAFRTGKRDLPLRPVFHQKTERVEAQILVSFLSLALWRVLRQWMQAKRLGDCARQLLLELDELRSMDVVLPTRAGGELRLRVVARPAKALANDDVWSLFTESLWRYQYTKMQVPRSQELSDALHRESAGIIDFAVKLFLLAQVRAISTGAEKTTPAILGSVAKNPLRMAQPALHALRTGDMAGRTTMKHSANRKLGIIAVLAFLEIALLGEFLARTSRHHASAAELNSGRELLRFAFAGVEKSSPRRFRRYWKTRSTSRRTKSQWMSAPPRGR